MFALAFPEKTPNKMRPHKSTSISETGGSPRCGRKGRPPPWTAMPSASPAAHTWAQHRGKAQNACAALLRRGGVASHG
eukprot:5133635-Alexandrium_andersonii.AAC.1